MRCRYCPKKVPQWNLRPLANESLDNLLGVSVTLTMLRKFSTANNSIDTYLRARDDMQKSPKLVPSPMRSVRKSRM